MKKLLEQEYVMHFIDMQKLIKNTWKIIIKEKKLSSLKYWDIIIYMVGQCHKSFQEISLSRSKLFSINEDFIKSYNEESDEGYFLKVHPQYPVKLYQVHNDLPILRKEWKLKE